MYLTTTRPNIMHVVSFINKFMESLRKSHLNVAKRIFTYLKGTIDFGVLYKKEEKSTLIGYIDSDYAWDQDDNRSTYGYVFVMGFGAMLVI